jgi:hypothetical protein
MTTLLDRDDRSTSVTPAQWLRDTSAAVRVSFTWLGVRKTLTQEQKNQAAEPFGAEGEFLSARKKLLDTKHPAYKEVTAVRGKVRAYWTALTLPFPEPGVRLIRQHEVERFNEEMGGHRLDLREAVRKLDNHYGELKATARRRLGALYNPNDYPPSLEGLFDLYWDFPNVEPPDYLAQLNPAIYEQEKTRVAARFDEAVQLAEQAFVGEFAKLIEHLTERLGDNGEGERKIFRDSAISNLTEFFDRFRRLNVRSNQDLDRLIHQAQELVSGVQPKDLRDNNALRRDFATQLAGVQSVLDGLLVDQPRRRIIRNNNQEDHSQ